MARWFPSTSPCGPSRISVAFCVVRICPYEVLIMSNQNTFKGDLLINYLILRYRSFRWNACGCPQSHAKWWMVVYLQAVTDKLKRLALVINTMYGCYWLCVCPCSFLKLVYWNLKLEVIQLSVSFSLPCAVSLAFQSPPCIALCLWGYYLCTKIHKQISLTRDIKE